MFSQDIADYKITNLQQTNTYFGGHLKFSKFDNDGNIISVGTAQGKTQYNNTDLFTEKSIDAFIYKTNPKTNQLIFSKQINAGHDGFIEVENLFVDQNNNIFISIRFLGTINVNSQSYQSENGIPTNIFIKITSNGDTKWVKSPTSQNGINFAAITSTVTADYATTYDNKLEKLDKNTGETILSKEFPNVNLNLSSLIIKNNQIYISGRHASFYPGANIDDFEILKAESFILKLDENLVANNILKSKTTDPASNSSGVSSTPFKNFFINNDNDIIFSIDSRYRNVTISSANNISTTLNVNSLLDKFWLGKVDSNFSNLSWFKTIPSSRLTFLTDNNNIFFSSAFSNNVVKFDNQDYTLQRNNLLCIDKDGNYKNTVTIDPMDQISEINELYHDNNADLLIAYFSNKAWIYQKNTNGNYNPLRNYTLTNNIGNITPDYLLKGYKDGSIYQSASLYKNVYNYLGQDFDTQNQPKTIISKSDSNNKPLWMISATGHGRTNLIINNNIQIANATSTIDHNQETIHIFSCRNVYQNCVFTDQNQQTINYENSSLITKINDKGELLWHKKLSLRATNLLYLIPRISNLSITNDNDNNIWISGLYNYPFLFGTETLGTVTDEYGSGNLFILKLSPNGEKLFFKEYRTGSSDKNPITFDENNNANILLNLFFPVSDNKIDFDGHRLERISNFVNFSNLKMSKNGTVTSVKNMIPTDDYKFNYINIESKKVNDGIILFGIIDGNTTLNNTTFTNPYNQDYKITYLISKINMNSDIIWSYPFLSNKSINPKTIGNIIDTDEDSNIYITNGWWDKLKYDNTEINLNASRLQNVLFKLSPDGNYISHRKLNEDTQTLSLSVISKDKILLAGNTEQNNLEDHIINNLYSSNYILFNLEKDVLSTQEATKKNPIIIYPNPTKDFINIKDNKNFSKAKIYDATGKLLLDESLRNNQINVNNLPKGIYYLELNGKEKAVIKFIKD